MGEGQRARGGLPEPQKDIAAGLRVRERGLRGADYQGAQGLHAEAEGPRRRMSLHQHHTLPKATQKLRVHGQRTLSVALEGLVAQEQEKPQLRLPHRRTHRPVRRSQEEPAGVPAQERPAAVAAVDELPLLPPALLQLLHKRGTQGQLIKDLPRNHPRIQQKLPAFAEAA